MKKIALIIACGGLLGTAMAYQSPELLLIVNPDGTTSRWDPYNHVGLGTIYTPASTYEIAVNGSNLDDLHTLGGNLVVTKYNISTGVKVSDYVLGSINDNPLWANGGFVDFGNNEYGLGVATSPTGTSTYRLYANGTTTDLYYSNTAAGFFSDYRNGTLTISENLNENHQNQSQVDIFSFNGSSATLNSSFTNSGIQDTGLAINGDGSIVQDEFVNSNGTYQLSTQNGNQTYVGDQLGNSAFYASMHMGHNDTFYTDKLNFDGSGSIMQGESPYGYAPGLLGAVYNFSSSQNPRDFAVYAAPEPSSFIGLGVALVGLLSRRKKAS